ncbi:MAG: hypothetical protein Q7V40_05235, partial [Pseudolabrys sp.]|nr:hypothetical protein [Pseudolabrys sp.]
MTALPLALKEMRAGARAQAKALALLVAVWAGASGPALADEMVKGEIKVVNEANYTRLVFRLDEAVDAKVRLSGAILVIEFKKPVSVAVDRINAGAPNVISAARRDPDGKAVRIALAQKFTVNAIPAAERLYIDLLPQNWTGVMPGLPQDVVDELASRTRLAEAQLAKQRMATQQKAAPTVRLKVAKLPTFMRYVFDLPNGTTVTPQRGDGRVSVRFDQQIKWDLADAKATLPPTLESIDAEAEFDSVAVVFQLNGTPDVQSFHEDRTFVVDIGRTGDAPGSPQAGVPTKKAAAPKAGPASGPAIAPPETVPAKDTPSMKDVPAITTAPAKASVNEPVKEPIKEVAKEVVKEVPKAVALAPAPVAAPVAAAPLAAAPVKAAEIVTPAPAKATEAKPPATGGEGAIAALVNAAGENLRIEFPFAAPTAAAVFRRSDTLWLVFDNAPKIDLAALTRGVNPAIRQASFTRGQDGEGIVRLRLARPQLVSAAADGPGWVVTLGDTAAQTSGALAIARSVMGKNKASIVVPFESAHQVHTITDPDLGDRLMIVTAPPPARGFLKGQDFVELRTLPSTHGVAIQPIADDVTASIEPDKITIGRPGGLSLSAAATGLQQQ